MNEPRFKVLDVVEIGDDPILAEQGLSGRRGAVTQIRQYPDGLVRYSIGSLTDDDEGVGGLYDEEYLHAVGERASIDRFRVPGPFREREIVVISADCDPPEIAGRIGEVSGSYTKGDDGEFTLGIWVEELGQIVDVERRFLAPTGERLPPPPAGRPSKSTRVSEQGEVLGGTNFIIVDELDRYL